MENNQQQQQHSNINTQQDTLSPHQPVEIPHNTFPVQKPQDLTQKPENTIPQQPKQPQPQQQVQEENKQQASSTQDTLLIDNIREDMVVLQDGGFRGVLTCKSINFDLMSSQEQEAIEFSYQMFLNSLRFPIQIFIRNQRVNIEPYIEYLSKLQAAHDNLLLSNITDNYIDFIYNINENVSIMDKGFFIIVEFNPYGEIDSNSSSVRNLAASVGGEKNKRVKQVSNEGYTKAKQTIKDRCDAVMSGLASIGINSVRLTTQELATLYYNSYNPDTAINQPLGDFRSYNNLVTTKKPTEQQNGGQNA